MMGDAEEVERLEKRLATMTRWYNELHYAVRKGANILDHKLTEEEAHAKAMGLVEKMHLEIEAALPNSVAVEGEPK